MLQIEGLAEEVADNTRQLQKNNACLLELIEILRDSDKIVAEVDKDESRRKTELPTPLAKRIDSSLADPRYTWTPTILAS